MSVADEASSPPLSAPPAGEDVVLPVWARCLVSVQCMLRVPRQLWVCTWARVFQLPGFSSLRQQLDAGGGFLLNDPPRALSLVSRAAKAAWTHVHRCARDELWPGVRARAGRLLPALRRAAQFVRSKALDGVRWVYVYSGSLGVRATPQCRGKTNCTRGATAATAPTPSAASPSLANSKIRGTVPTHAPTRSTKTSGVRAWLGNMFTFFFSPKQEVTRSPQPSFRPAEARRSSSGVPRRAPPPAGGPSATKQPHPSASEALQEGRRQEQTASIFEKVSHLLRWLAGGSPPRVSESAGDPAYRKRDGNKKQRKGTHKEGSGRPSWLSAARNVLGRPSSKAPPAAVEETRDDSKRESLEDAKADLPAENKDTAIVDAAEAQAVSRHHVEFALAASGEQPHDVEDAPGTQFPSKAMRDAFVSDVAHILPFTAFTPITDVRMQRQGSTLHVRFDALQTSEVNSWTKREIDAALKRYTFPRLRAVSKIQIAAGDLGTGRRSDKFIENGKSSGKARLGVAQDTTSATEEGHCQNNMGKNPQEQIPGAEAEKKPSPGSLPGDSQEPVHAETQEPVHAETQEPVHAETQEPVHAETQKPVHAETQEPVHAETQEPVHAETQDQSMQR
ncbi:uncharacterized protein Tco025E_08194, partial [Trypanosoma conorhini]